MKTKLSLILLFCLGLVLQAKAEDTDMSSYQNALYLSHQTVQAGTKQYNLSLKLKNTDEVSGLQVNIILPDGLTFSVDEDGNSLAATNDDRLAAGKFSLQTRVKEDGSLGIVLFTASRNASTGKLYTISGTDGEVVSVPIDVPSNITPGDYTIKLQKEVLSTPAATEAGRYEEVQSTLTITAPENRTLLDENSTTAPTASDGAVDVRVNRTIKGGEWSTICLPFDMSSDQLKAAFGDDVRLAQFNDWSANVTDEDNDEYAQNITVDFASVTSLTANTPYIIKTSKDITTFTVDGVTVTPANVLQQAGSKKKGTLSKFYGTYVAQTQLEDGMLFLSNNKFWYSVGKTYTKAYRCYLELFWTLDYSSSNAKINFFVDNTTTGIQGLNTEAKAQDKVFTLSGVCVGKKKNLSQLPKGVYIVNGKKIVNK